MCVILQAELYLQQLKHKQLGRNTKYLQSILIFYKSPTAS